MFEGYVLGVTTRLGEDKETVYSYFSMTDCMHHGTMTLSGQAFNFILLHSRATGNFRNKTSRKCTYVTGTSIFLNTSITEFNCDKNEKMIAIYL